MSETTNTKRDKYLVKQILSIFFVFCISGQGTALGSSLPIQEIPPTLKPISDAFKITPTVSPIQPQAVDFAICTKIFKLNSQKLFYLTLAGINANRFTIEEIKSNSGYIVFTAAQRQFLATVIKIDNKNSMLKITPCNNTYFFPVGIVQNMFKYIELNINTPVEKLSIL